MLFVNLAQYILVELYCIYITLYQFSPKLVGFLSAYYFHSQLSSFQMHGWHLVIKMGILFEKKLSC